jgi:hypothetical protein
MPDYLEDIKKDDDDNFGRILKGCTSKSFPSDVYAYQYRMHCVEQAFRTLGFSPQEFITNSTSVDVAIDMIDHSMAKLNIRAEDWSEHQEANRRGLAIYKDNEIAFFIALVKRQGDNFIVKSNVSFE